MYGLAFQKSQQIAHLENINHNLQQQLELVLAQYNMLLKQMKNHSQQIKKYQDYVKLTEIDEQMLQYQIKTLSQEQIELNADINKLQKQYQKVQKQSINKQQQLFNSVNELNEINSILTRSKQQYKMYITIGQSNCNIVSICNKLKQENQTLLKNLHIFEKKFQAKQRFFHILNAKNRKEIVKQKQDLQEKNKFNIDFNVFANKQVYKNMKPISNDKKISENKQKINKNKIKQFNDTTRKKNMILNNKNNK